MTALAVTGWAALTSAGPDRGDAVAALRSARPGTQVAGSATAVPPASGTPDAPTGEPPGGPGHVLDLDPRSRLGRKGTSALDRGTGLALVAAGQALADSGLLGAEPPDRVGVVLGTSLGGFRAAMDYSRQTLVGDRPYLVSAASFPTTVMNSAAGQVAIRYGLRGVNATVAGGRLAFLEALRFARTALGRGHADALLVGAVEEYSAQHAWRTYRTANPEVPAGEAAVVVAVRRTVDLTATGRAPVAELLALEAGFAAGADEQAAALGGCALRCLRRTGLAAADVTLLATGELEDADRGESAAVRRTLGPAFVAERVLAAPVLGDCQAAAGGLALAGLVARAAAPTLGLQTGRTPAGAVGAALWRLTGDGAG